MVDHHIARSVTERVKLSTIVVSLSMVLRLCDPGTCHKMLPLKDEHRLVLARGKRLLPFDQYRCKTEAITDDFAVTCACFNHTSLTILTATEKTVKVMCLLCFPC